MEIKISSIADAIDISYMRASKTTQMQGHMRRKKFCNKMLAAVWLKRGRDEDKLHVPKSLCALANVRKCKPLCK